MKSLVLILVVVEDVLVQEKANNIINHQMS